MHVFATNTNPLIRSLSPASCMAPFEVVLASLIFFIVSFSYADSGANYTQGTIRLHASSWLLSIYIARTTHNAKHILLLLFSVACFFLSFDQWFPESQRPTDRQAAANNWRSTWLLKNDLLAPKRWQWSWIPNWLSASAGQCVSAFEHASKS